jgi:hypothetical protein
MYDTEYLMRFYRHPVIDLPSWSHGPALEGRVHGQERAPALLHAPTVPLALVRNT